MQFRVRGSMSGAVGFLTILLLFCVAIPEALADKGRGKHGGHGHKGGHRGRDGGFHIGLGYGGLSYGYQGRDFSIQVGPGGYYPWYGSSYFPSTPYYYPTPDDYAPSYYGDSFNRYSNSFLPSPDYSVVSGAAPAWANGVAATELPPPTPTAPASTIANRSVVSTVVPTNERAAGFQYRAEQAFRNRQYAEALRMLHHAILQDSSNGKLLLFRSQAEFAVGDYIAAVGSLDQAMALLPTHDRGFVVQNFRRLYHGQAYVEQMDQLIQYSKQHPEAISAVALRAYHYLHLGHQRAAQNLLQSAAKRPGETKSTNSLIDILRSELESPS